MKKRILPILLMIVLCMTACLPVGAVSQTGSITILFRHQNAPIVGATFRIYRVAEWDGEQYNLTGRFGNYPISLPADMSGNDWKVVAATLYAYVARDDVREDASGATDTSGSVRFDDLQVGLYLVTGDPLTQDEVLYLPQPMLVSVPYTGVDNVPDFEVVTEPKYDSRKLSDDTVERKVIKIWEDNGDTQQRPQEITVQLLCDGEVVDEQTLSAANNWRYTWTGLDAAHNWQLTEKTVPEEYTVQVDQQGVTFTVTNTCDNPPPPPTSTPPGLPQTGMVWWPVPVLFGVGFLFLIVGIVVVVSRRKDKHDA